MGCSCINVAGITAPEGTACSAHPGRIIMKRPIQGWCSTVAKMKASACSRGPSIGDYIARLATIDEHGCPHVALLWFVHEQETIYLASDSNRHIWSASRPIRKWGS